MSKTSFEESHNLHDELLANANGTFRLIDATEDIDLYKVELKAGDTLKVDLDSRHLAIAHASTSQSVIAKLSTRLNSAVLCVMSVRLLARAIAAICKS